MMRGSRALVAVVSLVVVAIAVPSLVRPAEAAPSSTDGLIAFSLGVQLPPLAEDLFSPSDIYTVRPDGTGLRQLTHVPEGATAALPAWSPAGGAIAYETNASSDDFEIWAIGARGDGNHRVLRDPGFDDVAPTWTPDGRRIVFSRCDKPFGFVAKCALAVVNADGTGRRTILGGNNLHLKPVVSSDGRTIAFMSDRGGLQSAIWLVDIDGSHLRRLTAAKTRAFWPDFTPDGTHVLYSSNCCLPHSDIYSVPVGGGTATKLTNAPGLQDDVFESASPSGRNLLFWNSGTDPGQGTGKLVIRRSDGSQKTLLGGLFDPAVTDWGPASIGPTDGDGSRLPASAGHATHRAPPAARATPTVAPVGQTAPAVDPTNPGRIVFGDFNNHEIFSVSGDGGQPVQLTHSDAVHDPAQPVLSNDGRHIVFTLFASNGPSRIWLMNADGSNQHQVGSESPDFAQFVPEFTPDGRRLVFARCGETCAIWIMNVDGSNKRAITPFVHNPSNEILDFHPTVSPDGRHIAFTRLFSQGFNARVYVADIDGGNAHPVTPPWLEAGIPDFSPGGGKLVFNTGNVVPRLGTNIWTVRIGGSDLTRLTTTQYPNSDAFSSYSPDGTRIAFASDRRYDDFCCQDLFKMRTDGSLQQRVPTGANDGVIDPSWGPSVGETTTPASLPTPRADTDTAAACPTGPITTRFLPCSVTPAALTGRGSTSRFAYRPTD